MIKDVIELQNNNYPLYRDNLISLYLQAFTTGEYAQYISLPEAEIKMDALLKVGKGMIGIIDGEIVAFIIWTPLLFDTDFPVEDLPEINVEEFAYIAELVVHPDYHGMGMANELMNRALLHINEIFLHVIVRVWNQNKPALNLYRKFGFQEIASIVQTKFRSAEEQFMMNKLYMLKTLSKNSN